MMWWIFVPVGWVLIATFILLLMAGSKLADKMEGTEDDRT